MVVALEMSESALPSLPSKGAGVLWYRKMERGEVLLLMQQFFVGPGAGAAWWDFGGKRHATERSLSTACRECMEETDGVLGDAGTIRRTLETAHSQGRLLFLHDAGTQSYTVYVAPFPPGVSPDAALREMAPETDGKRRSVAWVPWNEVWDRGTNTLGSRVMARRIHACGAFRPRSAPRLSRGGRRGRTQVAFAPGTGEGVRTLQAMDTFFAST